MKPRLGYLTAVLVLLAAVLFAGCTSQPSTPQAPVATVSPGEVPPALTTVTASLPYGVTLTVPAGWRREDSGASAVRDYGMTTLDIATFYSPAEIAGDTESYNTLAVDLDQAPGTDFEQYFNQATLAVNKTYATKEQQPVLRSYTVTVSGYKTYELDFQTPAVKGSYFFTSTENGMYIFAFKGPNKPLAVKALQLEIQDIFTSISIHPPGVVVTQQR